MSTERETTEVVHHNADGWSVVTWCAGDEWRWGLYFDGANTANGTTGTYHEAVHAACSALAYRWVLGQED